MNRPMLRIAGLALLIMAGAVSPASGQALLIILFGDKLSTETFQMGINADVAWSGLSGIDGSELRRSWSFGAYGEIRLSDRWRLQPELTIKTPSGATGLTAGDPGNPMEPVGDSLVDRAIADGTVTRSAGYVSLPVYLKFVAGPVGIGAGGQVGIMTKAHDLLEYDAVQGDVQLERSVKDRLNGFDAGLVFSLDYAFRPSDRMRSLRLNAKYYHGLMDTIENNTGAPVRNSILFLGLDIPVGGSAAGEAAGSG